MKILIVDDESAIAQVFQQTLQKAGYVVVLASNGQAGLASALSEKPDLVLLDQILPDMNGNDVLKELKKNDATKPIPVALLSNFNQDGLVEEAMKNGAVDYILKYQISPQDLVEKVKQIFNNKSGSGWQDTQEDVVVS